MANLVVAAAITALPFVVNGVTGWVNRAVPTWGPAQVANTTIDAAANAGKNFFINYPYLSPVGEAAGKAIGFMAAPFAAQAPAVQNVLAPGGIGAQMAGAAAGALVQVIGNYALNKLAGKPQANETVAQQLINEQQLLQAKLQIEALEKINAQLNNMHNFANNIVVA